MGNLGTKTALEIRDEIHQALLKQYYLVADFFVVNYQALVNLSQEDTKIVFC